MGAMSLNPARFGNGYLTELLDETEEFLLRCFQAQRRSNPFAIPLYAMPTDIEFSAGFGTFSGRGCQVFRNFVFGEHATKIAPLRALL